MTERRTCDVVVEQTGHAGVGNRVLRLISSRRRIAFLAAIVVSLSHACLSPSGSGAGDAFADGGEYEVVAEDAMLRLDSVLVEGDSTDVGDLPHEDVRNWSTPHNADPVLSAPSSGQEETAAEPWWTGCAGLVDVASGSYSCADDGGCIEDCAGGHCGPRWTVAVDALMLWRGNVQSLPLFTNPSGQVALNANQLAPPMSAGPRFGVIRHLADGHAIEGNYFNVGTFSSQANLPVGGGPYTPVNLGDLRFDDIAGGTLRGTGRIQSAELNWRTWSGGLFTWIAGFRWVEWTEQTGASYAFENPSPYGSGDVASSVGNNLYGAQLGGDMLLWDAGGRLRVSGLGKAGVFYNSAAYQRSTAGFVYADGTPFPLGTVSATADQTSFFGEVGVNSSYWITNWLAWRVGYSVFWLSGVAVAADQLPLNNFGGTEPTTINTNGSVLLHGVTTGIEARW
jgi:hypothetical protein